MKSVHHNIRRNHLAIGIEHRYAAPTELVTFEDLRAINVALLTELDKSARAASTSCS